ncbi:MAG: UDP-N-acetylmuramate dehydrogenase [Betaproteobacteria bacterium]|nr:UDP-N-acetylmuramate dehydrogenase [Betaproteobacteria bacterium]
MNMADIDQIRNFGLGGDFRLREPMRSHTSWRTGGMAERGYFAKDLADLVRFIRTIPRDEPVNFVGLGSNLLVRDGGLRGTVVFTHWALRELVTDEEDSQLIRAQAGVAGPKVARFAATHNREGAEFLAGIPGTVGGALAMNAGCYGSETWEVIDKVMTLGRDGELRIRARDDFEIAYRRVLPRFSGEEWYVAAWFRFPTGDGQRSRARIKEFLQRRITTQPLELPNAGSVFRNPPGDYAARLIESCGLKGHRIGGAEVSRKHANFIVNVAQASAADIEALIECVKDRVRTRTGVDLEREVRIIGERA